MRDWTLYRGDLEKIPEMIDNGIMAMTGYIPGSSERCIAFPTGELDKVLEYIGNDLVLTTVPVSDEYQLLSLRDVPVFVGEPVTSSSREPVAPEPEEDDDEPEEDDHEEDDPFNGYDHTDDVNSDDDEPVANDSAVESSDVWSYRIVGENIEQKDTIEPVLRQYAIGHQRTVVFRSVHGLGFNPNWITDPATLYIFTWCLPGGGVPFDYNRKHVFGEYIGDCQKDSCGAPTPMIPQDAIINSPEDIPVALVRDNAVFVPFDLPHNGGNAGIILGGILDELQKVTPSNELPQEELLARRMQLRNKPRLAQLESLLKSKRELQAQYKNAMESNDKWIAQTELDIEQIQRTFYDDGFLEKAKRELQYLKRLAHVEGVYITSWGVCVTTDRIDFSYDGDMYKGRKYQILIGGIATTIHNIPPMPTKNPHPHVMTGGVVCWGNIAPLIKNYTNSDELVALVGLIIEFLSKATPGEVFIPPPGNWPLMKPKEEKEETDEQSHD